MANKQSKSSYRYICNWCWWQCVNKKGLCKNCDVKNQYYNWEYCWCRGWHLIAWQAFTNYECRVCKVSKSRPNTWTPVICRACAKLHQCIFCGSLNANAIQSLRKHTEISFHEAQMNQEIDPEEKIWFEFGKIAQIPKDIIDDMLKSIETLSIRKYL